MFSRISAALALLAMLSIPSFAGALAEPETLAIVFVSASGAAATDYVDMGLVPLDPQARGSRAGWVSTRQIIGIRVERKSGASASRTATLRASMPSADGRVVVRVGKVALNSLPQVVEARHALGRTLFYTVEFELPVNANEGTFLADIEWDVTEN